MISRFISLCKYRRSKHGQHIVNGGNRRGHAELELEPKSDVDDDRDDGYRDGPECLFWRPVR